MLMDFIQYKEMDMGKDKFMKVNVDLTKTGANEGPEYLDRTSDYCDIAEEKKEE